MSFFEGEWKPNFWLHCKWKSPLDSLWMGWWVFHGVWVDRLHFSAWPAHSFNSVFCRLWLHPFGILPLLFLQGLPLNNFTSVEAGESLGPSAWLYTILPTYSPLCWAVEKFRADQVSEGLSQWKHTQGLGGGEFRKAVTTQANGTWTADGVQLGTVLLQLAQTVTQAHKPF